MWRFNIIGRRSGILKSWSSGRFWIGAFNFSGIIRHVVEAFDGLCLSLFGEGSNLVESIVDTTFHHQPLSRLPLAPQSS